MKRNLNLSFVGPAIVCWALAGLSEAAPRAFVSVNGSDTNSCAALDPCRSFNRALAAVDAGGEIIVKDSGGYGTGVAISKSVTIDAGGFNASVNSTSVTDLCTIKTGLSDRVVLKGITFHGANVGLNAISVIGVGSLYVEHCSISEFTGDGVNMLNGGNLFVTDLDVRKCANGLDFSTSSATPANLVGHDCRFSECTQNGVLLPGNNGVFVTGWLSNCTASLCGTGFQVQMHNFASGSLTLTNCRAVGNSTGIGAFGSQLAPAEVFLANCVVTFNSSFGVSGAVGGTSPGTNLIVFNGDGNSTIGGQLLQ
jgi:hypothetical protein